MVHPVELRNMVFVHVPKTAGNTVYKLFPNVKHMGHESMHNYVFKKEEYVFAFVRNPYDRLVSTYFYLTQGGMTASDREDCQRYIGNSDWPRFVDKFSKKPEFFKKQIHMKDQSSFLDLNRINYLGRFENINDHLSTLLKSAGLSTSINVRSNSSQHRPYHQYYNRWIAMKAYRIYEQDFLSFSYCSQSWQSEESRSVSGRKR